MSDKPTPQSDDDDVMVQPVKDERSLARQIALQALYEIDSAHHPTQQVIEHHLRDRQPARKTERYVRELVNGVLTHQPTLDEAIRRYAPEYPIDQIAIIDRNILRISVYEFAIWGRTPVGVAIDEAVELAKWFGSDGSPSFINGVLGALSEDEALLQAIKPPTEDDGDEPE